LCSLVACLPRWAYRSADWSALKSGRQERESEMARHFC
jgi:hypothetical protein